MGSLLQEATVHYNRAQDALKAGQLGTYQSEMDQVGQLIQQAQSAAGTTAPTPTPTPRS